VIYVCNLVALGMASLVLRAIKGAPFVYDILDLWPDSVADSGMMGQPGLLSYLSRLCTFVYRQAAHVVAPSPGIQIELQRGGLPADRVSLIYNWADDQTSQNQGRNEALAARWHLSDTFNVMFAGTMGVMQGLDSVLLAARMLQHSQPTIRFVFVGGGVEREHLEHGAHKLGLENVVFLPRQPMGAMGPVLALADVLLVHLKDTSLFRITIPPRTQAYLAAGRPILMGVRDDAADLLERSGGGVVCQPEDPASIAEGVLRLYGLSETERSVMGCAGRSLYERELSLQAGADRFEVCFQRALAQRRDHSR
jgi:colanic acid biosynthesis glycosyl transferase WcaI